MSGHPCRAIDLDPIEHRDRLVVLADGRRGWLKWAYHNNKPGRTYLCCWADTPSPGPGVYGRWLMHDDPVILGDELRPAQAVEVPAAPVAVEPEQMDLFGGAA